MRAKITFLILTIFILRVNAQNSIVGKVINNETGSEIPNAVVEILNTPIKVITQSNGNFFINFDRNYNPKGIEIKASCLGFAPKTMVVQLSQTNDSIVIPLEVEVYELNTVVVTATRTDRKILEVPQRIDVVGKSVIQSTPALSVDGYLYAVSGISVSRGASIFGSADVSIRGMGNEAGRTLVMVDGVPINKGDGGTVNWNAISTENVKQIEVLKGSGSTLHGGNAMGGVINIITQTPAHDLKGDVALGYGTFSTYTARASLAQSQDKFYWAFNTFFRNSDGYIASLADEINEYSVPSFLNEYNFEVKTGFLGLKKQKIDLNAGYYSGQRGTGFDYTGYGFTNDSIASEKGAYNWYKNLKGSVNYRADFNEQSNLKLTTYALREYYENIRENLKNTTITRYDVLSIRDDFGLLSSYNFPLGKFNKINTGVDLRYGAVDAADTYKTSTDKVVNAGKMSLIGIYLLDEIKVGNTPLSFLAGIRYDYAKFFDGKFTVENPTNETSFLQSFTGSLNDADFSAVSPRLSMQYFIPDKFRTYLGYSMGYRPPVLDDLCRTGRISMGMKLANPSLKPEFLDNYEIGADILYFDKLKVSTSFYYSLGRNYHAYIANGDSIILNNKLRPIIVKSNIARVEIYGMELNANIELSKNFSWLLAYSYVKTNILEYKRLNPETEENLVGNELVFQPSHIFNTTVVWKNSIVNLSAMLNYKGEQWINDTNTEKIESYYFIDLHLWRSIYKDLQASIAVNNLLNKNYIDSRNLISPGRMVSFQLKYEF